MDNNTENTPPVAEKKPDESGGIYFSSFVKIIDVETGEILVQTRGDN